MSRSFNGTNQYARSTGTPVAAYPVTFACWAQYSSDVADRRTLMALDNSAISTINNISLQVDMATAGNPVCLFLSSATQLNATAGPTSTAWFHAAGVFVSATERYVYFNGGSKAGSASEASSAIGSVDTASIGARRFSSVIGRFWPGLIALAGMWSVALTDDEITALAKGASPRSVRPQGLACSWELGGNNSPETDVVGGYSLTLTGPPTKGEQPRIVMPRSTHMRRFNRTVAAGGFSAAWSRPRSGMIGAM